MNETLQQAITLARSGQIPAAAELLQGLVKHEPNNGEAWLWLAGLTADPQEQLTALNRVLAINPNERRAHKGLDALRQQYPELFAPAADPMSPQGLATPASFTPTSLPEAPSIGSHTTAKGSGDSSTSVTQPISTSMPTLDVDPPAPTRTRRASIYEAPTIAQPVIPRVPSKPVEAERRVASVTPARPIATPTAELRTVVVDKPRRNPIAFVARMLLALLWLGLTALLVLTAALALRYARQSATVSLALPDVLQNMTGPLSFSSSGGSLQRLGIVSAVLGVLGAIITLGMILRWRIALVLSLLVGFLIALAGVVIGVIAFAGGADAIGIGSLLGTSDRTGGIIGGILLLWPLLLAFVAWSEFSRPRQAT